MPSEVPLPEVLRRLQIFAETYDTEPNHGSHFSLEDAARKAGISYSAMRETINANCSGAVQIVVVVPQEHRIDILRPDLLFQYPFPYGVERNMPGPRKASPSYSMDSSSP